MLAISEKVSKKVAGVHADDPWLKESESIDESKSLWEYTIFVANFAK